jgi:hypothetical protein
LAAAELYDLIVDVEAEVEDAVVGYTNFPAVSVRICPPISDAPLNVVVDDVAVDVIVPKIAFTDLLHVPVRAVMVHPTSIVPSKSPADCALWV